ncbi:MAG: DUF484 family protein [Congregibacter sp.]
MNEEDIREFLVQHPDYLQRNPELLSLLQIPHSSGGAVSLVEKQVSVLRERNVDLRHRLRDLGGRARDNDQLFDDTRNLVLALLKTSTIDELHGALNAVLRDNFDVEYASLMLFEGALERGGKCRVVAESQAKGQLSPLLSRRQAGCGALRPDAFDFLFPGAKITGSAAASLITKDGAEFGVIAVGSSDAGRYDSETGTLFLEFSAEVLAELLPRAAAAST